MGILDRFLSLIGMDQFLIDQCQPIFRELDEVHRLARENLEARAELTRELELMEDGSLR